VRIAFVVHGYPPREAAGVELVAKEQADALVRRGHRVSVFARGYAGRDEVVREEVDGVRVWRASCALDATPRLEDTWDNRVFDAPFAELLDAFRPDVVHVQHLVLLSPNLLELARERDLPIALSVHDAYFLCHRLFLVDHRDERCPGPDAGARCEACLADLGGAAVARARFDFMARRLALADAVVAPSRALGERYAAEMPFLSGRIEVIEPGLATLPARAPSDARAARGDAERLRLLFVGTWLPHKGLDVLVDAVRRLDPARFELAIRGGPVAGREAWVDRLVEATRGLPVAWQGEFAPDRRDQVLSDADVLVLPSRCDESWSRVVREARAAGLAVVAPRTGGPGEALRDGVDALLVEPGSASGLARALERLVADRALVARLAAAPARCPTADEAAARLEELYARLHAKRAARARSRRPRVTVAYVTKNGAELLDDSLSAVRRQQGDFELVEILAVDSGSRDGTLAILERHGARVLEIAPEEFGHGRTRNLAVRAARGDVVVFLTQDASPAHDEWLARLLAPLAADPLVAGAWSRHVPRSGCHPMEWRRVVEFPLFAGSPVLISSARGNPDYARNGELASWFSNNASAIPRALLERWPFPDVEFAEDQAWARLVLEAGFRTALVNDSVVYHSHAYSPWTNLQRNFDHACAMRDALGRRDDLRAADCVRAALRETRRDIAFWAAHRGRNRMRVAARWAVPAAAYHLGAFGGRWLGARAARLPAGVKRTLSLRERQRAGR